MECLMRDELDDLVEGEDNSELIHKEENRDCAYDVMIHEGDLEIDGHYDASNDSLVVKGDLKVAGTLFCDESGNLTVTGNLYAQNMSCEGYIEVQGDAHVEQGVFGDYEGGCTHIEGTLFTKVLLQGEHWFEIHKVEALHTFEFSDGELDDDTIAAMKATLADSVFQAIQTIHIDGAEEYDETLDEVISPLMSAGTFLKI